MIQKAPWEVSFKDFPSLDGVSVDYCYVGGGGNKRVDLYVNGELVMGFDRPLSESEREDLNADSYEIRNA
jgi:hypothetical protein